MVNDIEPPESPLQVDLPLAPDAQMFVRDWKNGQTWL
jgi:hypothetical protein